MADEHDRPGNRGQPPFRRRHPFRVARFTNSAGGTLERGPIAVFEGGAFLGQGMVDPLPAGATATVPFALERSIAVDQDRKFDEMGARLAKIENSLSRVIVAVSGGAVVPQGSSVVQGDGDANELRIEPCAAAILQRIDCAFRTASGGEDIEMLCDGADAGE